MDDTPIGPADDAFERAVEALAHFGSGIESENLRPWLSLPKHVESGRALGLLALKPLVKESPCGVKIGPYATRTTLLWIDPVLAIVEPTQTSGVRRANLYRFPPGFGPDSCESVEELPRSAGIILEPTSDWQQIADMFETIDSASE